MPKISLTSLSRPAMLTKVLGGVLALGLLVYAGQASFSTSSPPTYTVQAGDSLWTIASTDGLTVSQLAAANGLNPSSVLLIGTHLTIPAAGSTAAQTTAAVTPEPASSTSASDFCASFTPQLGSYGVLPAQLADNSARLALRPIFVEWAEHYGVSPALLEAIAWQESGWQQGVVSTDNAVGVGQLLPSTATFVSQEIVGENLDINATSDNIRMEAAYLGYLQGHEGSTCATIAGYYEGLQNMENFGVFAMSEPYVASVESLVPNFE